MFASKDLFLTRPSGGYTISRSVRLRSSASAYFNRTAGTPTNANIWTWSAWVKRGTLTTRNVLFCGGATNVNYICFGDSASTDNFGLTYSNSPSQLVNVQSTAVYRDLSSWYHLMVVYDSTSATSTITGSATDRVRLYVNGVQLTSFTATTPPAQNTSVNINAASAVLNLGRRNIASPDSYLDGYLTEINFIDGQALTPSSFGSTNAVTGVWQPAKYTGTYGTNGFYLNFSDNSAATAAAIGKDYSGNGNNWTPNNISVTAGATYDSMLDTPTPYADGGNGRGNYPVMNPLDVSLIPFSNGNLTGTSPSSHNGSRATMSLPTSGKYYWEATTNSNVAAGNEFLVGVANSTASLTAWTPTGVWGGYGPGGPNVYSNNAFGSTYSPMPSMVAGVVWQIAYDAATQNVWIGYNNVWYTSGGANTGNPSAGTGQTATASGEVFPYFEAFNLVFNVNFGQRPFTYTPPSGFVALNTYNLSTPTIANGASYMAATTYTGTGASLTIANTVNSVSFQPDFVWVKGRSGATDHALYDSVRGTTKDLASNTTAAETTQSTGLTAFGSTGFTVGALAKMNTSAATYVGWQWQAGAGTSSSNTSGSITSTVSVNATAGFSVVTYTGTGANATVGHGLGVAPSMVIVKGRSNTFNWGVWQTVLAGTEFLILNLTNAKGTQAALWNSTTPTSSVFSVGTDVTANQSTATYVAYCFAAVAGYSKFGSYTGNGSTDGPFVFLGFRPRWVMIKGSSFVSNWNLIDTARNQYNVEDLFLRPNSSAAEFSGVGSSGGNLLVDVLSNGFKIRDSGVDLNTNGATFVYAAFAENPFKYALAR